jgi:hypothetical protein
MLVGEGGALAWDGSKPFAPFGAARSGSRGEEGEEEEGEGEGAQARTPEASAKDYAKKAASRFS